MISVALSAPGRFNVGHPIGPGPSRMYPLYPSLQGPACPISAI